MKNDPSNMNHGVVVQFVIQFRNLGSTVVKKCLKIGITVKWLEELLSVCNTRITL